MTAFGRNVLLTSAGRRNYLVADFRAALDGRGLVLAADADGDAAALQEADRAFVVPSIDDPGYAAHILELCIAEGAGLVVPLNDLDLPVLAANRQLLLDHQVFPLVSSPQVVNTCFDKDLTADFLRGMGISTPQTFLSLPGAEAALVEGRLDLPVVVKPRWGSGSLGVQTCHDIEELRLAFRLLEKQLTRSRFAVPGAANVIVQEELRGTEYGLDVVNDLEGQLVCVVVKQKLAMRAGETDRARTVCAGELHAVGEAIGRALGHVGNLDCDVFWISGKTPKVLEMNPRFGGGYPFSRLAGFDLPRAVVGWLHGEVVPPAVLDVRDGVAGAKCDRLVTVR